MAAEGIQVITKGAHKDSITATNIKINTLFQTFKRIKEGCTFDCLANLCTQKFIYEIIRGYKWPLDWIMVSLYRIQNHKSQNAEFWIGLTLQIKKLTKKYVHVGTPNLLNDDHHVFMELIHLIESSDLYVNNMISLARKNVVRDLKEQRQMGKNLSLAQNNRLV